MVLINFEAREKGVREKDEIGKNGIRNIPYLYINVLCEAS